MSGGSGAAPWLTAAQFESGFDMLLASARGAASMVGITGRLPPLPPAPAWPVAPASMTTPPLPWSTSGAPGRYWQPAIATATPAMTATCIRSSTGDRPMANLQEVDVLRNLTVTYCP